MDRTRSRLHAVQVGGEPLADLAGSHSVVIFRSPLTDLGPLPATLHRHGTAFREVVMSMKSAADRDRFRELRHNTGQRTLPQVFIDGRFVGGINEACRAVEDMAAGDIGQETRRQRLVAVARMLGYGGLVPFAAGAAGAWWPPAGTWAVTGLLAYAAVILTFVGAVHWGLVVARNPTHMALEPLAGSVLPALYAWLAVWLLPAVVALWIMAAGFAGVRLYEMLRRDAQMPVWYRQLRNHLTLGAIAALVAGALA